MSIGNAINSLPLAYAPVNGTGRKVAYGLSHQNIEASIDAVPTVIVSLSTSLDSALESSPEPIKYALPCGDVSVGASVTAVPLHVHGGFADQDVSVGISSVFTVTKMAAFAETVAAGLITPVPLRVRAPFCDFRSLYTAPGESIAGNALNSFALGSAPINSSRGGVWRTFVSICDAVGDIVFMPTASAEAQSVSTPKGNAVFDPSISSGASLSSSPHPVFVLSSFPGLQAELDAQPKAMAYRPCGAILSQDVADASGFGVLVIGGNASPEGVMSSIPYGASLFDLRTNSVAEGLASPFAVCIASGRAAHNTELDVSLKAYRGRVSFAKLQALADLIPIPWDPLLILVSYVYAQNWSSTIGLDVVESTVLRPSLESIVYRVSPESLVYGRQNEI